MKSHLKQASANMQAVGYCLRETLNLASNQQSIIVMSLIKDGADLINRIDYLISAIEADERGGK